MVFLNKNRQFLFSNFNRDISIKLYSQGRNNIFPNCLISRAKKIFQGCLPAREEDIISYVIPLLKERKYTQFFHPLKRKKFSPICLCHGKERYLASI